MSVRKVLRFATTNLTALALAVGGIALLGTTGCSCSSRCCNKCSQTSDCCKKGDSSKSSEGKSSSDSKK